MRKDYEKLFTHLEPPEPPVGLFNRILFAIKQEQELQSTKRLALSFLALLVISLLFAPFSWSLFSGQMVESGVLQFMSIAINDLETFFALWQDFSLAIAESLPVMGIAILTINIILAIFTIRLFLYKRRLLLGFFLQRA